jgi:osmotically-inducible protein OsmY
MSQPIQPQPGPWQSPADRYYYGWYDQQTQPLQPTRTDGDLKSEAVDRLRVNEFTKNCILEVNVQAGVVVLAGNVPSVVAKRAAGDDAWDIAGVMDVSNQLRVVPAVV